LSLTYMPYLDRDALLIHLRVLMDFIYKGEDRDDVRAHHYIPGGQPLNAPEWYKDFRDKCNKLFAHLTYGRTEFRVRQAHHWREIPERVESLEGAITGFLRSLTPERRAWFDLTDGGAE